MFDINSTDNIVCPSCGYEHDPVDWEQADNWDTCDKCGFSFNYYVDHSVTYSTNCREHKYGEKKTHEKHGDIWWCDVCGDCVLDDPHQQSDDR